MFKKKEEIKGFKRHEFLEIGPESRLIFHSIKECLRMTGYIVRFDTETARANSIVFIIRLLIGFVIGVYDRTLQYSNLFLGIQHGFLLHEFPHLKYIHVRPRKIAGRSNSHFLMKKKYVVNWLTETVILLGARLKLRDVFLEAFTSIITISSGCSLGIQYLEPSYSTFYREWFSET